MIFDQLTALPSYASTFAAIDFQALTDFVLGQDLLSLAPGKHLVPNSNMYANLEEYTTVAADTRAFETHQWHADFQIILQGRECMEFATAREIVAPLPTPNHLVGDYQFFTMNTQLVGHVIAGAGSFVYFPVGMPHRPSLDLPPGPLAAGQKVRKLVVKIPVAPSEGN